MEEFIKTATPYVFGIILALGTWFYNLIEKRINARAEESKALLKQVTDLEKEVGILKERSNQFHESLRAISEDLKRHLDGRIDSLRELMLAKIPQ